MRRCIHGGDHGGVAVAVASWRRGGGGGGRRLGGRLGGTSGRRCLSGHRLLRGLRGGSLVALHDERHLALLLRLELLLHEPERAQERGVLALARRGQHGALLLRHVHEEAVGAVAALAVDGRDYQRRMVLTRERQRALLGPAGALGRHQTAMAALSRSD